MKKPKHWGILFRWVSWWVGAHWSSKNRRLCLNLVPMVTIWITWSGGRVPLEGFDICRTDDQWKAKYDLLARAADFIGPKSTPTECKHDHKLQGTGAVFYQSVGLLQCGQCGGWQKIRKPVR